MLNATLPNATPALNVDRIFGPKTLARTIAFQKAFGLAGDGVVGPNTWTKLDEVCPPPSAPATRICGNSDPGNLGRANALSQALPVRGSRFGVGEAPGNLLKPIRTNPHFAAAAAVFSASLDYDRIFWTTQSGLQDRPFTIALPNDTTGGFIQVLNLGAKFGPKTVIHEMTHAWLSQHHHNPVTYMQNCIACQKKAVEDNLSAALFNPRVARIPGFPVQRPFTAYGFIRGRDFGDYGGEMIAEQVEAGVDDIVRLVRSAPPHVPHSGNVTSLTKVLATDMRNPRAELAPPDPDEPP